MPSQLAPWKVYRQYVCPLRSRPPASLMQHRALAPLKYGDALWLMIFIPQSLQAQSNIDRREPGPIYSYRRVRPGDVGYTRRGRFHLLFSAGVPLGSRKLGTDVPSTFEPLDIGPIISGEIRSPGYLRTDTVREIGVDVGGSVAIAWCVCACFCLAGNRRLIEHSNIQVPWSPAQGWPLNSPAIKAPP